jgi:hypothetical protein
VLAGAAASFTTTTLLNESGEVGRRSVKVQLKNNLSEAIGVGRPIRIQFGVIGPATSYATDLRTLATVSSVLRTMGPGYADGSALSAMISAPSAMVSGADGSIYFNGTDNRVRKFADGNVSTVAQNVPATSLAYVRDPSSGREFLIAACATVHSIKAIPLGGGPVANLAGTDGVFGNVNGTGAAAQFNGPSGICFDSTKNQVLIADSGNGSIRALPITFTAGNMSGGAVTSKLTGFSAPKSVAISSNGTLGIVEPAVHRVRLFSGGFLAGTIFGGVQGNVVGDGSTARFTSPSSITAIGDAFFVADAGNYMIKRISLKPGADTSQPANWNVAYLAGAGLNGGADGTGDAANFSSPGYLASDSTSRLLVPDGSNNALRRIVSSGSFDFGAPDGGGSGQATLVNPSGFADLNGLQRPYIDVSKRVEPGQSVDIGEWQFSIPSEVRAFRFAVTVEAGTSVYAPLEAVLNPSGGSGSPNVVAQYLSRGGAVSSVTGNLGDVTFDSITTYIASAADGTVFVSDGFTRTVRRIDLNGTVTLVAGKAGISGWSDGPGDVARLGFPDAIRCNPEGTELILADEGNNTIRRIGLYYANADPKLASNWSVSTIAGVAGAPGDANGSGDAARFRGPVGIAGPSNDSLYVTEYTGYRLRSVRYVGGSRSDPTSWYVDLAAGAGVQGFADGAAGSAKFSNLVGCAYAPDGKVYIVDRGNYVLRAFDTFTRNVVTVAGTPGVGGSADNANALAGTFAYLNAVATDASGAVYLGDSVRVRRLLNGSLKTVAGGGDGSDTSGDKAQFGSIYGMGLNTQGDLLLNSNSRLVRLTRKVGR